MKNAMWLCILVHLYRSASRCCTEHLRSSHFFPLVFLPQTLLQTTHIFLSFYKHQFGEDNPVPLFLCTHGNLLPAFVNHLEKQYPKRSYLGLYRETCLTSYFTKNWIPGNSKAAKGPYTLFTAKNPRRKSDLAWKCLTALCSSWSI